MATGQNDTERALLPGALLVGAVLLILGAGFVLSTNAPKETRQAPPPPPQAAQLPEPVPGVEVPAEDASPAPIEEMPAPTAPPAPADLAARATHDLQRLGQSSGRYTAQIVVACKPETVERLIEVAPTAEGLYVL